MAHPRTLSIVTGCYNEEGNLQVYYDRVKRALAEFPQYDHEIIIADNCSTDGSRAKIMPKAKRRASAEFGRPIRAFQKVWK